MRVPGIYCNQRYNIVGAMDQVRRYTTRSQPGNEMLVNVQFSRIG